MGSEQKRSGAVPFSRADRLATVLLYAIFALTGMAVVLPGTLLPMLSARWHMGDGRAGILFLFFSAGSTGGAFLARGLLSRALTVGCLLVGFGAAGLSAEWHQTPLPLIALYGCGLGIAMTSISLLQSRRRPAHRVAEMAKLNLAWALGACGGPAVLLHATAAWSTTVVLRAVALIFFVLALMVRVFVPGVKGVVAVAGGWLGNIRAIPLFLLLLIPLATGIESGVGGWLSTYTARAGDLLNVVISATTAFWAGLVLSRLYHSRRRERHVSKKLILRLHPWITVAGLVLLITTSRGAMSVAAAFLIGSGIGPLYPLALALLLDVGEAGNAGFLLAGAGASLLPMLTGLVSAWSHSLRAGLGVLLAASAVAMLLGTGMLTTGANAGSPADEG